MFWGGFRLPSIFQCSRWQTPQDCKTQTIPESQPQASCTNCMVVFVFLLRLPFFWFSENSRTSQGYPFSWILLEATCLFAGYRKYMLLFEISGKQNTTNGQTKKEPGMAPSQPPGRLARSTRGPEQWFMGPWGPLPKASLAEQAMAPLTKSLASWDWRYNLSRCKTGWAFTHLVNLFLV